MGKYKDFVNSFLHSVLPDWELAGHPDIERGFEDIINGKILIAVTGKYPSAIKLQRCHYGNTNLGMRNKELSPFSATSYLTDHELASFKTIRSILFMTMELWLEQERKIATMFDLLNSITSIIFDNSELAFDLQERIMHPNPIFFYEEFCQREQAAKKHVQDQIMLLTHYTHKTKTQKEEKWNPLEP